MRMRRHYAKCARATNRVPVDGRKHQQDAQIRQWCRIEYDGWKEAPRADADFSSSCPVWVRVQFGSPRPPVTSRIGRSFDSNVEGGKRGISYVLAYFVRDTAISWANIAKPGSRDATMLLLQHGNTRPCCNNPLSSSSHVKRLPWRKADFFPQTQADLPGPAGHSGRDGCRDPFKFSSCKPRSLLHRRPLAAEASRHDSIQLRAPSWPMPILDTRGASPGLHGMVQMLELRR